MKKKANDVDPSLAAVVVNRKSLEHRSYFLREIDHAT